jgi:glutamate-1-semialdehyde aminotransferase
MEPIQGEAGVVELPEGYLAAAREITARHGALLIVDEIQTGAGRTGAWFGFQHAGIVPDAITVAKGIGGGFPIGALVTSVRRASCSSPAPTARPSAATPSEPPSAEPSWPRSSPPDSSRTPPCARRSCARGSPPSVRR